jgi:hypothetical protein
MGNGLSENRVEYMKTEARIEAESELECSTMALEYAKQESEKAKAFSLEIVREEFTKWHKKTDDAREAVKYASQQLDAEFAKEPKHSNRFLVAVKREKLEICQQQFEVIKAQEGLWGKMYLSMHDEFRAFKSSESIPRMLSIDHSMSDEVSALTGPS